MFAQETLEAPGEEVEKFVAGIAASLAGSEKKTTDQTPPAVPVPTSPVSTLPSSASQLAKDSVCRLDFMVRFTFFFLNVCPIVEPLRCTFVATKMFIQKRG